MLPNVFTKFQLTKSLEFFLFPPKAANVLTGPTVACQIKNNLQMQSFIEL